MPRVPRVYPVRLVKTLSLAAIIIASSMVQTTQAHQSRRPELSGVWRLNEVLSANWSQAMSNEVGADSISLPAAFDAGSLPLTQSNEAANDARVQEMLKATRTLEIFQQRRELTMNATGSARIVLTRTFLTAARHAAIVRFEPGNWTQAKWAENRFVIQTKTERGPQLTETYELSGGRLYLSVKIENDRRSTPWFVLRIYDKVPT